MKKLYVKRFAKQKTATVFPAAALMGRQHCDFDFTDIPDLKSANQHRNLNNEVGLPCSICS